LPAGQSGLTAGYASGNLFSGLAAELAAVNQPDTVITSIDLREDHNTFALSTMQTSQTTGFDASLLTATPSDLPGAVAIEGSKSRVVTAITFDLGGDVEFFSYGWQSDASTVYDTSVLTATKDTLASQASALAAGGYIITALGGNNTIGFLLVGTKVHGDT